MEPVTPEATLNFLRELGARWHFGASLYLIGGGALALLGNPRQTLDLDYTAQLSEEGRAAFRRLAEEIGIELHVDVEEAPIGEFVPLPPGAEERSRFLGRFGSLDVYIFDLYTIALSKIARGFESDFDDVLFMLRADLIEFAQLERYFDLVVPKAAKYDIDHREFRMYFEEIRRRGAQPPSTQTTP